MAILRGQNSLPPPYLIDVLHGVDVVVEDVIDVGRHILLPISVLEEPYAVVHLTTNQI